MDRQLIDYLKSGKAWVLVGSGPSIAMKYPSWKTLAEHAVQTARHEVRGRSLTQIEHALAQGNFPQVFEEAKVLLTAPRLLQVLLSLLKPEATVNNEIYKLIARWPVPVYLTTNYDDEIQRHLIELGEAYITYDNSSDHMSQLIPELQGAIFKLHGDLRSDKGLILTTSQYQSIEKSPDWQYWCTKMTSVFQMNRVIVIGHSLTDPNIRYILRAAKEGAGVVLPVIWIAPDVTYSTSIEYLEQFRIHVISYDNQDKSHRNLVQLIKAISHFIPSRPSFHIRANIEKASNSPLGTSAAAPGIFIFSKLNRGGNFEQKRVEIMVAAIQSVIPQLSTIGDFTLQAAVDLVGWPKNSPLPANLAIKIREKALEENLLITAGAQNLRVSDKAGDVSLQNQMAFEQRQKRFQLSVALRLKRIYPSLSEEDVNLVTADIEAALVGYFMECGLSLTTTLFSNQKISNQNGVPALIMEFISEASNKYDDLLRRQAFITISLDIFLDAADSERDYLGRMSQGFFAFHFLGVWGEVAIERLAQARRTVWLIDSNAQIPTLALGAPTNVTFRETFRRLREKGIRLFTTEKLFEETYHHWQFAKKFIRDQGANSIFLKAAATGQSPYKKSNQFLEGFIVWRGAGKVANWESYLFAAFKSRNPSEVDLRNVLQESGIEIIPFQDWPGFSNSDFSEREEQTQKIVDLRLKYSTSLDDNQYQQELDFSKKAQPEAEALIIIRAERYGQYHIMSQPDQSSPSWFISDTSLLNITEEGQNAVSPRITWQSEAFLRFASTLVPANEEQASAQAFETILLGIAKSGISVLDEQFIENTLGSSIDQTNLPWDDVRQMYEETLREEYAESFESIMARTPPSKRPLAAIQLANQAAQVKSRQLEREQERADTESKRADATQRKLNTISKFTLKQFAKRKERAESKKKKQKKNRRKR
ncbi:MAG: SIR2 family protein [Chloroflexota bacterium]